MQCALVITLFLLAFFQGAISERILGVSYLTTGAPDSPLSRLLVELLVAVNLIWLWLRQPVRLPPGSLWFGLYGAWSLLSGFLVEHSLSSGFMYCRYTLYGYVVYLVCWNYSFTPHQLRRITQVLVACFAVQMAASAYEIFIAGERVEWRVGTMMISSGELAALFPLISLCFAAGYYFYVRQSWWVLAAGLSFGLVGFSSGKRAVYFLIPMALGLVVALFYLQRDRRSISNFFKLAAHIAIAGLVALPAFVYGLSHSHGINAAAQGTIPELIQGAADFAVSYESGVDADGMATGRVSASTQVMQSLTEAGLKTAMFGWGPQSLSRRGETTGSAAAFAGLNIAYGIVGWSHDAISIGLPGAFAYLTAYCFVLKALWRSMSLLPLHPSWQAVAFGTVSALAVLILSYLFYGSVFMFNGVIPFVLFFYAGVLIRPGVNEAPQTLLNIPQAGETARCA